MINRRFQSLKQELTEFFTQPDPQKPALAEELWAKTRDLILVCDKSYYEDNKSLISDTDYDFLVKDLEKLENLHPRLKEASPTRILRELGKLPGGAAHAREADELAEGLHARDPQRAEYRGL
jgi:hypothetical protein